MAGWSEEVLFDTLEVLVAGLVDGVRVTSAFVGGVRDDGTLDVRSSGGPPPGIDADLLPRMRDEDPVPSTRRLSGAGADDGDTDGTTLVFPLVHARGGALGLIGVAGPGVDDLPELPDRLAVHGNLAARSLVSASGRDALDRRLQLAWTARQVVRSALGDLDLDLALRACEQALAEGFRADLVTVRGYATEEFDLAGTPSLDASDVVNTTIWRSAAAAWARQSTIVVARGLPTPDGVDATELVSLLAMMDEVGIAIALLAPVGAGDQCLGHVILGRAAPLAWTAEEREVALDIGHDLGAAIRNARAYLHEQRLAEQLRRVAGYRTRLVSTVAHEIKTPLSAVVGHLEMLETAPEPARASRDSLEAMDRAARRLTRVVDDLLLHARVADPEQPVAVKHVDLRALVEEVVDLTDVLARARGLTVTVSEPPGDVLALGDRTELDRVVANLIGNALKFTPDGGQVRIVLRRLADVVELEVTDDGIGMSDADRARVFTEFFRSDDPAARAQPGTGLGLAIVGRIVARHRGRITVASELGVGTTVRVELPRSRGQALDAADGFEDERTRTDSATSAAWARISGMAVDSQSTPLRGGPTT